MTPVRVMIVVTPLLGTRHLSRALTFGRALVEAGHAVDLVSGGFPVPQFDTSGLSFHQLPPLRSDGTDFSRLLGPGDAVATARHLDARKGRLTGILRNAEPDILITELFPFGRRNLLEEFRTLLESARDLPARPRVFSSIRDILAPPSKPAKQQLAEDMIARHYDAVLVHSDKTLIGLEASWPVSADLAKKVRYTGFVASSLPPVTPGDGTGAVLVSTGGGGVGDKVFKAALQAAGSDSAVWRLLVGGQDPEARIAGLCPVPPQNVTLEPARADFRSMLRRASASVSLCGYNTVMDLLRAGLPAVVVPFDDGGETEQSLRAEALAGVPGIESVPMRSLDGPALLAALHRAKAAPKRDTTRFRFDGARETVRMCLGHVR